MSKTTYFALTNTSVFVTDQKGKIILFLNENLLSKVD